MSNDPLLQPYQLKHLTLRNRIMTTSHEPAYGEDGMPKDRYRLYHLERAKAGVAMVMTAGSASVSRDSPPVFTNLLVWKDEIVPWMKRLTDDGALFIGKIKSYVIEEREIIPLKK